MKGHRTGRPGGMTKPEALAYWLASDNEVFVAEVEGAVLGTYFIRPNQLGGGAHVCNCGYMTAAAAPGQGIGRAMGAHSLEPRPAGRVSGDAVQLRRQHQPSRGAFVAVARPRGRRPAAAGVRSSTSRLCGRACHVPHALAATIRLCAEGGNGRHALVALHAVFRQSGLGAVFGTDAGRKANMHPEAMTWGHQRP